MQISQKQRIRARKLLNTATEALSALVNERLNIGNLTSEEVHAARQSLQNAQSELDAQPSA